MNQEKRCGAFVVTTKERCKRRRIHGSKYCWHHHPWGTTIITGVIISAVVGFCINIVTNKMSEKAPILEAYLNGYKLAGDTVLIYPTNQPSEQFTFEIKNIGNFSASDMFAMMNVSSLATNFIYGPKWIYEEVGWVGHTDPKFAKMVQYADKIIPPNYAAKFQPFWVNREKVRICCGWLNYGATGAETKNCRISFAFDNPAGKTNVLYGKEARQFLEKVSPPAGLNENIGVVQFIFQSTNQLEVFQRTGTLPP